MEIFENIDFIKTSDDTTGLYDKNVDDIYHAKQGALSEAVEKFINPISESFKNFADSVSVLDICYGIGYNSKAFLSNYINFNNKIYINILEENNLLVYLSPFINDGVIDDDLKLFLLQKIVKTQNDFYNIYKILEYMFNHKQNFLSQFGCHFFNFMHSDLYKNTPFDVLLGNLHNIYYKYISTSMNCVLYTNIYKDCSFCIKIGDARNTLKESSECYDVVFLDGFSPKKDPVLWTIDFLSLIKSKMKSDGLLISYSKSTPFRSALLELGFNVGKNITDIVNNTDNGTIASFDESYIQHPLSDYDLKIISSTSGIPYRDKDLNLAAEQILQNREIELNNSSRISRSQIDKFI